jgi:hypothetical protein
MRGDRRMSDNEKVKAAIDPMAEVERGMDAKRRADNCLIDIQNVLKRCMCVIDPRIEISSSTGVKSSFAIVPLVQRPTG